VTLVERLGSCAICKALMYADITTLAIAVPWHLVNTNPYYFVSLVDSCGNVATRYKYSMSLICYRVISRHQLLQ
jgi:hypothetical protein